MPCLSPAPCSRLRGRGTCPRPRRASQRLRLFHAWFHGGRDLHDQRPVTDLLDAALPEERGTAQRQRADGRDHVGGAPSARARPPWTANFDRRRSPPWTESAMVMPSARPMASRSAVGTMTCEYVEPLPWSAAVSSCIEIPSVRRPEVHDGDDRHLELPDGSRRAGCRRRARLDAPGSGVWPRWQAEVGALRLAGGK